MKERLIFIMIVAIILTGFVYLLSNLSRDGCESRADMLNVEWEYHFFRPVNCIVKCNDSWIPIENCVTEVNR